MAIQAFKSRKKAGPFSPTAESRRTWAAIGSPAMLMASTSSSQKLCDWRPWTRSANAINVKKSSAVRNRTALIVRSCGWRTVVLRVGHVLREEPRIVGAGVGPLDLEPRRVSRVVSQDGALEALDH